MPAVPQAPDSARHRRRGAGNSRCRQRAGSCQAWLPDPCRHPGCPASPPRAAAAEGTGLGGFGESRGGRRGVKAGGAGRHAGLGQGPASPCPLAASSRAVLRHTCVQSGSVHFSVPLLRADTAQRHPPCPTKGSGGFPVHTEQQRRPLPPRGAPRAQGQVSPALEPQAHADPWPWRALTLAPLSRRAGREPGAGARALLLETQPEGFPKGRCLLPGGAAAPSPLSSLNCGAAGGRAAAHPQLLTQS